MILPLPRACFNERYAEETMALALANREATYKLSQLRHKGGDFHAVVDFTPTGLD